MSKINSTGIPEIYKYVVKINTTHNILIKFNKYFNQHIGILYGDRRYAHTHTTGEYKLDKVDVWIVNQEKQGFYYYWFKSEDEFNYLLKKIEELENINNEKSTFIIYKYDSMGWNQTSYYKPKDDNYLLGYRNYINSIYNDIENFEKNIDFLEKIGESSSLNYLLYGEPGTGKTTLIRELCSKYKLPVFIVNPNNIDLTRIDKILNPPQYGKISILLFEDFDRFMENKNVNLITSQILNSLDGFDDKRHVIRFFTANNPDIIFNNKALINRMCAKFKFDLPTKEIYQSKFKRLLENKTNIDEEKINKYIDLVAEKNVSLRAFVRYTLRYLFNEKYLDNLIENIHELN
jgi:SpoVK/Ycf46/Vps4 family AAA+-type ATPase